MAATQDTHQVNAEANHWKKHKGKGETDKEEQFFTPQEQ